MTQTRAQLQARLDGYHAAELKILQSQEYQIGDGSTARKNRRADLREVRASIEALSAQIAEIDRRLSLASTSAGRRTGGGAIRYARPVR